MPLEVITGIGSFARVINVNFLLRVRRIEEGLAGEISEG